MTQRSSAWSTERSRSTGAISTPITSKANTWRSLADPKMRCSLSTPGLRLIRTPPGCWRCEATRRTIWAVLSKPNPISNRPCCSVLATLRWASGSICATDTELGLGRFDEAIEDAKKAIEGGHRVFYTYLNLAAAHAFKGEMDEAKAAMAEARRLKPDLSIKWLLKHKPVLQFAFDGLRKAGLPEE